MTTTQNEPQKRENAWITHLNNFKKKYPDVPYKEIMKMAQDSYVKKPKSKSVRIPKKLKDKKAKSISSSEDEIAE